MSRLSESEQLRLSNHIKALESVLRGDGRELEYFSHAATAWFSVSRDDFVSVTGGYWLRIKPQWRPWKLGEVPVGATIIGKETALFSKSVIVGTTNTGILHGNQWALPQTLFDSYTINGQPCGVKE